VFALGDTFHIPDLGYPIACLTAVNYAGPYSQLFFHQTITTIGRASIINDWAIQEKTISGRQASLWFSNGFWFLLDHASANGTFINAKQLDDYPQALRPNDVINFGVYETKPKMVTQINSTTRFRFSIVFRR